MTAQLLLPLFVLVGPSAAVGLVALLGRRLLLARLPQRWEERAERNLQAGSLLGTAYALALLEVLALGPGSLTGVLPAPLAGAVAALLCVLSIGAATVVHASQVAANGAALRTGARAKAGKVLAAVAIFTGLPLFGAIAALLAAGAALELPGPAVLLAAALAAAWYVAGAEAAAGLVGLERPLPPDVAADVDALAARMRVPLRRAFVVDLEGLPLATAGAFLSRQSLAIGSPLLALPREMLLAIAAHELGHLSEGRRERRLRAASFFVTIGALLGCYLGAFAGWPWGLAIALPALTCAIAVSAAARRMLQRLEQRADASARQHVGGVPLARALWALYEQNLVPPRFGRGAHPPLLHRIHALTADVGTPPPPLPRPPHAGRVADGRQLVPVVPMLVLLFLPTWLSLVGAALHVEDPCPPGSTDPACSAPPDAEWVDEPAPDDSAHGPGGASK